MSILSWSEWLIASEEADCHSKLKGKWDTGCCRVRRGRLVRVRLMLWLLLAEKGYLKSVEKSAFFQSSLQPLLYLPG